MSPRPRRRTPRLLGCLTTGLALSACGDGGAPSSSADSSFTVRDSAGVAIARSTGPAWPEGGGWRLADEPLLTLGSADGGSETLFEVGSIVPLADGRFALAHGSRNEIAWFDSTGVQLATAGREGKVGFEGTLTNRGSRATCPLAEGYVDPPYAVTSCV